jgi:hypothetical protein
MIFILQSVTPQWCCNNGDQYGNSCKWIFKCVWLILKKNYLALLTFKELFERKHSFNEEKCKVSRILRYLGKMYDLFTHTGL